MEPSWFKMIPPRNPDTFKDYFMKEFVYPTYFLVLLKRLSGHYFGHLLQNLESGTREQRASGLQRSVTNATKIPGNYAAFLQ